MNSRPNSHSQNPASHDEPTPLDGEDSVPQDDGTDNRWQMEPLEQQPADGDKR